jgi:hypothetical protein
MPWRITKTTDDQHIGTVLEHIEAGQVVTFEDGDVVAVTQIFAAPDGVTVMACGVNYQMTLIKE